MRKKCASHFLINEVPNLLKRKERKILWRLRFSGQIYCQNYSILVKASEDPSFIQIKISLRFNQKTVNLFISPMSWIETNKKYLDEYKNQKINTKSLLQTNAQVLQDLPVKLYLNYIEKIAKGKKKWGSQWLLYNFFKMKSQERKTVSKIGWTQEEEEALKRIVEEIGNNQWAQISRHLNRMFPNRIRTNKQCRERFMHYIRLEGKRSVPSEWGLPQLKQLLRLTVEVGTRWSVIHRSMPCWSENFLKNKFHGIVNRLLRKVSNICRSKSHHPCKEVQFNTLIRVLDFSEEDQAHSEQAAKSAQATKIKILEEAFKVEQGLEDLDGLRDLEEAVHNFTTLNRAYLMSMGKKRSAPKKIPMPLKEETVEKVDQGHHSVLILNLRSACEAARPQNKYFLLPLTCDKIQEPTKSISEASVIIYRD